MGQEVVHRRHPALSDQVLDLHLLQAESRGVREICIAVLDGPVDLTHPCFLGADVEPIESPSPLHGTNGLATLHGTHVASILFGQPGTCVEGIAPNCRGLVIPVFAEQRDRTVAPCSQLDLARAITQAVAHGANVINISGGELETSGQAEPTLAKAVELCHQSGVLVVAAAGNDGCACAHVPAALPSVLVVGAVDHDGEPLAFSNWGDAYAESGILAPGEAILGASAGGGTVELSGTSAATPIVSGVAALLMSVQLRSFPSSSLGTRRPDAQEVRRALLDSAVGCRDRPAADCRRFLSGRLNIRGALARITKGSISDMSDQHTSAEKHQENRLESYLDNGNAPAAEHRLPPMPEPAAPAPSTPRQAAPTPAPVEEQPTEKKSSGCGCGGNAKKTRNKIYALGQIDCDFGSEANRDSFIQQGLANPNDHRALLAHLKDNPWSASNIIWTLCQETTPMYAVQPAGPFAAHAYERLQSFLASQLDEGVSQVSIPGMETGQISLLNGQQVPVVIPDLRGMYSWSTPALVKAVLGDRPQDDGEQYDRQSDEIANFLDRIYYEISNLGLAPQERAINYSATNAFQAASVYRRAIQDKMKLDTIDAERSRVCRPGADCWDVKLTFFDPTQRQDRAKIVHRFTVDVSEVVPVTVGPVRSWEAF